MADRFVPTPRDIPTNVVGLRDPASTLSQRVIADVSDEIALYQPRSTPFMTLLSKIRNKRTATQYRFDWLEKDEFPRSFNIVTDGGTTITVGSGEGPRLTANALLINSVSREIVLVSATPTTDAVTVVRSINGITATMLTDGSQRLILLGSAYEDGSTMGSLVSIQEADQFNYCQIIRTPFGFTGRQASTSLYGGRDTNTERKFWGIEHAKTIEYFMFFGARFTRTGSGGKLQTGMGGLEYYLKSNVWDLGGNKKPTARSFDEWLEYAMKWGDGGNQNGSATKYFCCSSRWRTELDWFAKDKIEYRPVDGVAGLKIGEYQTSHGRVMIVTAPILDYEHQDRAFLLDLNHLSYVFHQDRDTRLLQNREANDADQQKEEYFSDVSLVVELEGAHAAVQGLPL